jgi:urocanate hydratase
MRLKTRYLDRSATDPDEALVIIDEACAKRRPVSVGLLGNAAEILPQLVRRGARPHLVTDQTSAHDLVNGYLPARWTLERWRAAQSDPARHAELVAAAKASIRTHVEAMLAFHAQGIPTVDYGNNIRQVAADEGLADAFAFPGFVPAYIRPLFCEQGPFRWVALSGDAEAFIGPTARCELFPDNAPGNAGSRSLRADRVPGLPARICWLGLGERLRRALTRWSRAER